jgi:hypothetical protein
VLVSSILSPSDMQTGGAVSVTTDSPDINETQRIDLNTVLTAEIHRKYKLGANLPLWYNDVYFEYGAKCIAVLPTSLRNDLLAAFKTIHPNLMAMSPKDVEVATEQFFLEYHDCGSSPKGMGYSTPNITVEDMHGDIIVQEALSSIRPEVEEASNNKNKDKPNTKSTHPLDKQQEVELLDYVNGKVKKLLISKPSGSDITASPIKVTYDATVINKQVNMIESNNNAIFETLFERFDNPRAPEGDINKTLKVDDSQDLAFKNDHPLVLELPASSVIPITIPGNPKQHIAYFVLVDEFGTPYVPTDSAMDSASKPSDRLIDEASRVYNQSATAGSSNSSVASMLSKQSKALMLNAVFNVSLKRMLKKELTTIGLGDVDVQHQSAISTAIFYKLLQSHAVRLVFVPASLMVYYAVDYNQDGTGKSLLEDAGQIMSLRASLIVANVMATMQSAIRHHQIFVDLDPENTQAEAYLQMVQKWFIEKHELTYADNLPTISRNILSRSVQVIPRGLTSGDAPTISVESSTETGRSGIQQAPTEMIDRLTEMVISNWGIPFSVFNRLSEDEFSRSVATNNLLFANFLREQQYLLSTPNDKLVRLLVSFDRELRDVIAKKLQLNTDSDTPTNGDGTVVGDSEGTKINPKLVSVIRTLKLVLPEPNVVIDKTSFTEITEFVNSLRDLVDVAYPNSIAGVDENNNPAINMDLVRENVKAALLREYMAKLSVHAYKLPEFVEVLNSIEQAIAKNGAAATNKSAGILRFMKVLNDIKSSAVSGPSDEAGEVEETSDPNIY